MSRVYVTQAPHVVSALLDQAAVLVDLHAGKVEVLLGERFVMWKRSAATGDPTAGEFMCDPSSGQDPSDVISEFRRAGWLTTARTASPWQPAVVPPSRPSWGTQEVPGGLPESQPTSLSLRLVAAFCLAATLFLRESGRRSRAFARMTGAIRRAARRDKRATHSDASESLASVREVARYFPFRVACLEETTAAVLALALRGKRVGWCHGIAADPIRLHAWMTVDDRPVAEPPSTLRYTPLLRIPDGAA